ncbi:cytochrome P450 [Crepidotus variabilis]|uniref:Cytochrome P450 n=1 Tax=Crepidotus variabilis TaxID=179855 RepID=A0A9P6JIY3_9AGAR|nr:cytochrome P450 [Crepidotus variabilis]
MASLNPKVVLYCLLAYVALQLSRFIFKRFFVRSPLNNLRGPAPKSFLTGSFEDLFNPKGWAFHNGLSKNYGNAAKIKGVLGDDVLYVFDPLAMRSILLKDQNSYGLPPNNLQSESHLIFGPGLLGTLGEAHKKQRKMLTPLFSTAHLKDLVPLFFDVGHKLESALTQRVRNGAQEIDLLSWSGRTALELIAQSALGKSFDPLTEDTIPHPYAVAAKQLMIVLSKTVVLQNYILPSVMKIGTARFRRFMLDLLPFRVLHDVKDISDVMHSTSVEIYNSNMRALSEGNDAFIDHITGGKDLISTLMKSNLTASKDEKLLEAEILAQMSSLTFAGTDTTSSAIARTLWLLSQHQDVQDKLRDEIREAMLGKTALSYDELNGLKYLDAVCRELLRLYTPAPMLGRVARENAALPLSTPLIGVDGQVMHEILVPKGTLVLVSILNHNRNPDLWGLDAEEFKPERWDNLPEALTDAHTPGVYSNLMTFGGGTRSCIGFKFSQLEMKVIVSLLINKFKFSLPKDKVIFWNMTNIVSPCVVGDAISAHARLPLIVEEAK